MSAFEKKFPPAHLLCPASLMFFKNFPTCTFISSCTSIRYTRVRTLHARTAATHSFLLKWQCRLIFESEFWKKFKVTNHRSGVTYGCTDQHLTVEKKNFQSLPSHLADTVENIKNQPYRRWKIVFLIIQRKWPKFKKWVWPVKIPWKLSILCL